MIFCLLFLNDSPRYFILKENYNKASSILRHYDANITDEMKNTMIKEIKELINNIRVNSENYFIRNSDY
jgi:hypothetical protein